MHKLVKTIAVAFTAIIFLSACSSSTDNSSTTQPTPTQTQDAIPDTEGNITITMSNFAYAPNVIKVKPGDTLRIELNNRVGSHDLVLDELDIESRLLGPGQSEILEIIIPEDASGKTYEFYCSVSNHRELGMTGTIIVE